MRATPSPDLEQPPRADAQEAVPPEALAALDGLEQVGGRRAVVEAQEGADRRLEVGRARGAQQDRVGRAGEALGFGQAQRVGHRGPSFGWLVGSGADGARESRNDLRLFRDERSCLPRCHPRSAVCRTLTDGSPGCATRSIDRRCPVSLALCAGAYLSSAARPRRPAFGPVAPGSIRRRRHPGSHQPPGLWNGARRVLVPIKARIRDVARSLGATIRRRQARSDAEVPTRRRITGSHARPPTTWRQTDDHDEQAGTDSTSAGTCHEKPSNAIVHARRRTRPTRWTSSLVGGAAEAEARRRAVAGAARSRRRRRRSRGALDPPPVPPPGPGRIRPADPAAPGSRPPGVAPAWRTRSASGLSGRGCVGGGVGVGPGVGRGSASGSASGRGRRGRGRRGRRRRRRRAWAAASAPGSAWAWAAGLGWTSIVTFADDGQVGAVERAVGERVGADEAVVRHVVELAAVLEVEGPVMRAVDELASAARRRRRRRRS